MAEFELVSSSCLWRHSSSCRTPTYPGGRDKNCTDATESTQQMLLLWLLLSLSLIMKDQTAKWWWWWWWCYNIKTHHCGKLSEFVTTSSSSSSSSVAPTLDLPGALSTDTWEPFWCPGWRSGRSRRRVPRGTLFCRSSRPGKENNWAFRSWASSIDEQVDDRRKIKGSQV